jgi:hypothetical protein
LSVTSTFEVVFPQPVTLPQLFELRELPDPDEIYVDLALRAGPQQREIGGLDMEVAGSFRRADSWGFIRVRRMPTGLVAERPLLAGAATLLHDGLVIDLTGLDLLLNRDEPRALDEVASPGAWAQYLASESSDAPVDELVRGLLSGKLAGEQLPQFVNELERIVPNAEVRQRSPGEWLLTGRRFRFANPQSEDARMLERAVLTIVYRERSGVQSVALEHVGAADGVIRFWFVEHGDTRLTGRARFTDRGARMVTLDAALNLFFPAPDRR